MGSIGWNPTKSKRLLKTRGISFEKIIEQKLLATILHPERDNQRILVFEYKNYCWAVPCVMSGDNVFFENNLSKS